MTSAQPVPGRPSPGDEPAGALPPSRAMVVVTLCGSAAERSANRAVLDALTAAIGSAAGDSAAGGDRVAGDDRVAGGAPDDGGDRSAGGGVRAGVVDVIDVGALDEVPMFRPELVDDAPAAVGRLRAVLERADAVAIAAPEYAGGVAGWVKNALDWLVGSATLYGRPVAVFSAGTTGGPHALAQLARTLAWQGAHVVAAVGVEAVRTKLDHDGRLAEPAALAAIGCAAQRLLRAAQGTDDERAALAAATLRPLGIDPVDRRPR